MSLINWLRDKPTPRYYCCSRAGYGIQTESQTPVLNSFGLLRFDSNRLTDNWWKPFGQSRFIVPLESVDRVEAPISPFKKGGDRGILTSQTGECSPWSKPFQEAKKLIHGGQLDKIVLARRKRLKLSKPIDPLDLLEKLEAYFPSTHLYLFEPEPGIAFLGASPERLYHRQDFQIFSEAQAGTAKRGITLEEDQSLAKFLLSDSKIQLEHELVVQNISHAFSTLCSEYQITNYKQIAKLPNVQHLKTQISGKLKTGVSDREILPVLHPTAAVAGWPIHASMKAISKLEEFDRGFYTGTLGYISEHESEFTVAIRGAMIQNSELTVFAGAGIVDGSDELSEREEIENKMSFWEKLL